MIIDSFMYAGQQENFMLEIRLNVLKNIVDKFILMESNFSHSQIYKGLSFDINQFPEFKDRIIYVTADFPNFENYWGAEFSGREVLLQKIKEIAKNDTIFLHGDLDELPDNEKLEEVIKNLKEPTTLLGNYYQFTLDLWGRYPSPDTIVMKLDWLDEKTQMHQLRRYRTNQEIKDSFKHIENAGWHYSSVNTVKNIIKKYHFYAHANEVNPNHKNEEYLKNLIKGKDEGRGILKPMVYPNCPKYLEQNIDKYKQFLYANYV